MNSTGQDLSGIGLVSTASKAATGTEKSLGNTADNECKCLNKKEFSEILSDEGQSKNSLGDEQSSLNQLATGEVLATTGEEQAVDILSMSGKALPIGGTVLPPVGQNPVQALVPSSSDADVATGLWSSNTSTVGMGTENTVSVSSIPLPIADQKITQPDNQALTAAKSSVDKSLESHLLSVPQSVVSQSAINLSAPTQLPKSDNATAALADMLSKMETDEPSILSQSSKLKAAEGIDSYSSTIAGRESKQFLLPTDLFNGKMSHGANLQQITEQSVSLDMISDKPATINPATAVPGSSQISRLVESPALQTAIPIMVGKPGWSEAVAQRVMWMSSQNVQSAEIALDPPELGPMHIRISAQADQTAVTFVSSQVSVREALDQGVFRLREMMENQGLELADVNVSDQDGRQQHQAEDSGQHNTSSAVGVDPQKTGGEEQDSASASHQQTVVNSTSMSLVDHYV